MAGAMKFVFLAVAVVCYMQTVEMARLPRDSNTGSEPALPANFLESLTKPEFWNSLSTNFTSAFTEENLKKFGIRPVTLDDVKEGFAKVGENVQAGIAELSKNINTLVEQPAAEAKPKKTKK